MWRCANCDEQVEDHFEICWNCQLTKDGTPQPIFEEKAEAAKAILTPHLYPGEFLRHWAYGVRLLSIKTKLLLSLLGIIGAIMLGFALQASFLSHAWSGESNRLSTGLWFGVMTFLFYTLAKQLIVKRWVVGLTNHRFILVLCENDLSTKQVVEYKLAALPSVKTQIETGQAILEIRDAQKPFKMIFHQTDWADNFRQSVEILRILAGLTSRARSSH